MKETLDGPVDILDDIMGPDMGIEFFLQQHCGNYEWEGGFSAKIFSKYFGTIKSRGVIANLGFVGLVKSRLEAK